MMFKNERDHRTFQMSNSLLQLRHIHYKNPQVSCTQLRCKTPPINIFMIISPLKLLHICNSSPYKYVKYHLYHPGVLWSYENYFPFWCFNPLILNTSGSVVVYWFYSNDYTNSYCNYVQIEYPGVLICCSYTLFIACTKNQHCHLLIRLNTDTAASYRVTFQHLTCEWQ